MESPKPSKVVVSGDFGNLAQLRKLESPHKQGLGNKACVEPAAASCGPQEPLNSRKEMPEDK